jgi:predicted transcriptional regulator
MNKQDVLNVVATVAGGYLAGNKTPLHMIPYVFQAVTEAVDETLANLNRDTARALPKAPAVPVEQSVKEDRIISLIDGNSYVVLTRHLKGYGLTPNQYRAHFNLPDDYPIVAPGYSKRRRKPVSQEAIAS